jgi:YVTN family beta-propeller protein
MALFDVIDTISNSGISSIYGGIFHPDGTKFYFTSGTAVCVVNVVTKTVTQITGTGNGGVNLAITPDGTRVYSCATNGVKVINTSTNAVTKTISIPANNYDIEAIVINPAGTRAYTANGGGAAFSVIDLANDTVIATIPMSYTRGIAVNSAGTKWYGADRAGSILHSYNASNNTAAGSTGVVASILQCGPVISPDGTKAYCTSGGDSTTRIVNLSTMQLSKTLSGSGHGWYLCPNKDFSLVFGCSFGSSIVVIDTATETNVATLTNAGFSGIAGLVVNPQGDKLYAMNNNSTISVISIATSSSGFFTMF